MKPNVDLTERRDFRGDIPTLNSGLRKFLGFRFPWDEITKTKRIRSLPSIPLVATGSKDERQSQYYEFEIESSCERCARDLRNVPWKNHYGICTRCSEQIDFQISTERDLFLSGLKEE